MTPTIKPAKISAPSAEDGSTSVKESGTSEGNTTKEVVKGDSGITMESETNNIKGDVEITVELQKRDASENEISNQSEVKDKVESSLVGNPVNLDNGDKMETTLLPKAANTEEEELTGRDPNNYSAQQDSINSSKADNVTKESSIMENKETDSSISNATNDGQDLISTESYKNHTQFPPSVLTGVDGDSEHGAVIKKETDSTPFNLTSQGQVTVIDNFTQVLSGDLTEVDSVSKEGLIIKKDVDTISQEMKDFTLEINNTTKKLGNLTEYEDPAANISSVTFTLPETPTIVPMERADFDYWTTSTMGQVGRNVKIEKMAASSSPRLFDNSCSFVAHLLFLVGLITFLCPFLLPFINMKPSRKGTGVKKSLKK